MNRYWYGLILALAMLFPLGQAHAGCGEWGPERSKLEVWINSLVHAGATDMILGVGEQGEILRLRGGKWSVQKGCTESKMMKIRRSGDLYIAVGAGVILISKDGSEWDLVASGLEWLKDVAYNGSTHLVVGNEGTLLMSPDGRAWKNVSKPEFAKMEFEGATWFQGRFYVAGYDGVILSSADGKEWQDMNSGVKEDFKAITGAGGRLIAVGKYGRVVSSGDGIQWSSYKANTKKSLRSIAWSGKEYVAVGFGGVAIRSTDGVTWEQWAVPDVPTLVDVVWTGRKFLAAAKSHVIELELPR